MSMLEIHDIRKQFGKTEVLKGLSLSVDRGEVAAVLGPSGSGKTTLLRCINFLEKADSGTMVFDQQEYDLGHMKRNDIAQIRKKTAFVFQDYNLFANKTALGNVTLGLTSGRKVPKEQARETGLRLLDKVGLHGLADHYPVQMSGGQQQRVAIARALATDPEIIYFDEPTSALDPELIGEVLDVMKDLAEDGMTMLVVTHEMNFAENVSDKVIFMADGEIVETSESRAFFRDPKEARAREFLSRMKK